MLYRIAVKETSLEGSDPTMPSHYFDSTCDPAEGCVLTEGNEFVYVTVYSSSQSKLEGFSARLEGCIGNSSCSSISVPEEVIPLASNPFLVDPVPKSGRLAVEPLVERFDIEPFTAFSAK